MTATAQATLARRTGESSPVAGEGPLAQACAMGPLSSLRAAGIQRPATQASSFVNSSHGNLSPSLAASQASAITNAARYRMRTTHA